MKSREDKEPFIELHSINVHIVAQAEQGHNKKHRQEKQKQDKLLPACYQNQTHIK